MALSELLPFYQMHPVPAQELDESLCCFILVDTAWKISEKCFLDNSFWITHRNIQVRYLSIGTLLFSNVNVFKPPELNKTFIWFSLWLYLEQILLENLSHHFQISIIINEQVRLETKHRCGGWITARPKPYVYFIVSREWRICLTLAKPETTARGSSDNPTDGVWVPRLPVC